MLLRATILRLPVFAMLSACAVIPIGAAGCGATLTGAVPELSPTTPAPPPAPPAPAPPAPPAPLAAAPFSTVLVLGDSISAGFQNGSLLDTQQPNGWASLVAKQAGFRLRLPLITHPGLPSVYELIAGTLPPELYQEPGYSVTRDNPDQQVDDLAVPGFEVNDLLNTAPVPSPESGVTEQLLTSLVLGYPAGTTGTQLAQAIARQPTTLYLWIGSNDALLADGTCDPTQMTPLGTFTSGFTQVMATLKQGTTAHLFVANIPDVTKIPYMTQASELLPEYEAATGVSSLKATLQLQIHPGDLLNWAGLSAFQAALNSVKQGLLPAPIPARYVLTSTQAAQVRVNINAYNQVIQDKVLAAGGTLVDIHGYLDTLASQGITINGYAASTLYLGGLFGLDGIHFSNTGYALLANQFISRTNATLGTTVPLVNVGAIAATDPYFGANRQNPAPGYGKPHVSPAAAAAADTVLFSKTH